MAVIKAVSSKAGIGQALDYVTKEEKTEDKQLFKMKNEWLGQFYEEVKRM